MSKITLIGKLISVSEIESKENFKIQKTLLEVQNFDQNSGEALRKEVFPISFFNEKIGSVNAPQYVGKRVRINGYLKSVTNIKDSGVFHNLMINGVKIESVE